MPLPFRMRASCLLINRDLPRSQLYMSIIITLRLFAYDVGIEQGTIQYSPPITPGPSGLPPDLHRHCGGISHIRRAWGALKGVISK